MTNDYADYVAELANLHCRMVFATAYRVLGNTDDAEDVLQEVFLKMLRSWTGRLKPVADWGAYLRVMASRCAVDLLRRKPRWAEDGAKPLEDFPAPADQNPRHAAIQRQRAMLLRRALQSLRKRDARIFALRYFEDLSYDEIARQTGLSTQSVGVILHRARKRLRKILEPILGESSSAPDSPQVVNSTGRLAAGREGE